MGYAFRGRGNWTTREAVVSDIPMFAMVVAMLVTLGALVGLVTAWIVMTRDR